MTFRIFILVALNLTVFSGTFAQRTGCWQPPLLPIQFCIKSGSGVYVEAVSQIVTPLGKFSLSFSNEQIRHRFSERQSVRTITRTRYVPKDIIVIVRYDKEKYVYKIVNGSRFEIFINGKTRIIVEDGLVDITIEENSLTTLTFEEKANFNTPSSYEAPKEPVLEKSAPIISYRDFSFDEVLVLESLFGLSLGDSIQQIEKILGAPNKTTEVDEKLTWVYTHFDTIKLRLKFNVQQKLDTVYIFPRLPNKFFEHGGAPTAPKHLNDLFDQILNTWIPRYDALYKGCPSISGPLKYIHHLKSGLNVNQFSREILLVYYGYSKGTANWGRKRSEPKRREYEYGEIVYMMVAIPTEEAKKTYKYRRKNPTSCKSCNCW